MYRLVDDHQLKKIVLDFQSVEHLSSACTRQTDQHEEKGRCFRRSAQYV